MTVWFFFSPRIWHFMQIVSNGDNLHEMSNPIFLFSGKNQKSIINLSSAELAERVIKVKFSTLWCRCVSFYFHFFRLGTFLAKQKGGAFRKEDFKNLSFSVSNNIKKSLLPLKIPNEKNIVYAGPFGLVWHCLRVYIYIYIYIYIIFSFSLA